MSNPVASVTQVQQPQATDQAAPAKSTATVSKPQGTPTDTVNISSASKAILQEVLENHSQTVQEANGGDSQARRLLAREAAATITPKG